MWRNLNLEKFLSFFSIIMIVLSSNTLVYCVMNMKLCMLTLAVIAVIYVIINNYVDKSNIVIAGVILTILVFTLIYNNSYSTIDENTIILLIRCFFLMIVASNVSKQDFVQRYVNTMLILSVISLVCFTITMLIPSFPLPFRHEVVYKEKFYIYTFYHTLGRWSVSDRNCGIFWEPGGYQIFLNIALLMLFSFRDQFLIKWRMKQFVWAVLLISSTILSTLSTTGILCLLLVLIIGILKSGVDNRVGRVLLAFIVVIAIAVCVVEARFSLIETKIVNKGGSYGTRANDVLVSFDIASERILGYGYSNSYVSPALRERGVSDLSSGLGSLAMSFGFPGLIAYLIFYRRQLKKFFRLDSLESFLALILFVLFMLSENVYSITVMLAFLYTWKETGSFQERIINA